MPKNYTKEELENGRWVTMNGARVFIKDGDIPEDAFDRALNRQPKKKPIAKKKDQSENAILEEKYKHINPNFKASDDDPYGFNCTKCALAFEANMRGNDVEAEGFDAKRDRTFFAQNFLTDAFRHDDGTQARWWSSPSFVKNREDTKLWMNNVLTDEEEFGIGSRAIIEFRRRGNKGIGHVINAVVTKNGVVYIDAQKGKQVTIDEALKGNISGLTRIYRVDDANIVQEYADRAYKKRGK